MVLIETSAWVEFLRNTGSPACQRVDELLDSLHYNCPAVSMEILAGARDASDRRRLQTIMSRAILLPVGAEDFDCAADLYVTCRRAGETVRKLLDCLTAATAIKHDIELLHNDNDFDVLARHTPLRATRG